jgi:hypothetical protein
MKDTDKLDEEQQALAQGNAAMAADTLFHSKDSVDSMSLGSQIDSKDSLIFWRKIPPAKYQKLLLTSNANKTRGILVYPFIAGDLIECASKGLLSGEDPIYCSLSHLLQLQQEKAQRKNHVVTMNQDDINRSKPGEWLNYCLIDFWMMWIIRKEPVDENWVHIFKMQFYTSMVEKWVDHVLQFINNYTGLCVAFLIQELLLAAMMKSILTWKCVSHYSS